MHLRSNIIFNEYFNISIVGGYAVICVYQQTTFNNISVIVALCLLMEETGVVECTLFSTTLNTII